MTSSSTCRWCGRDILWLVTYRRGRPMCVDPAPNRGGNVAVVDGRARVLKRDELDLWEGQLWMPHFATCTHVRTRHGTRRQI